jgi:ATP-binding cassette subfamily B protein
MATEAESAVDRYRNRIERPIYRLFSEYGLAHSKWFVTGMTANVLARGASLLPPVVLDAALDAIFGAGSDRIPYRLPLVPNAWLPEGNAAQFRFSVALIVGAFLLTAVCTWIYGMAANNFAHRVMHDVRTDSFAKLQNLDMPFFDDKQTGEVMAVLNNVHESEALVSQSEREAF